MNVLILLVKTRKVGLKVEKQIQMLQTRNHSLTTLQPQLRGTLLIKQNSPIVAFQSKGRSTTAAIGRNIAQKVEHCLWVFVLQKTCRCKLIPNPRHWKHCWCCHIESIIVRAVFQRHQVTIAKNWYKYVQGSLFINLFLDSAQQQLRHGTFLRQARREHNYANCVELGYPFFSELKGDLGVFGVYVLNQESKYDINQCRFCL